jgi:hypothetical protein
MMVVSTTISSRDVASIPHSWDLAHWPSFIYPHDLGRAKYLIRVHRRELLAARALVRCGRELVVLGRPYVRWLERKSAAANAAYNNGAARTKPPSAAPQVRRRAVRNVVTCDSARPNADVKIPS